MWIPSNSQRTGNEDKNDPNPGELPIPYDFEVCHIAKLYRMLSKWQSALAGRALGIRVRNYQGTKISMFDRNKKEMFRDLNDEVKSDMTSEDND